MRVRHEPPAGAAAFVAVSAAAWDDDDVVLAVGVPKKLGAFDEPWTVTFFSAKRVTDGRSRRTIHGNFDWGAVRR
jgi:hypothetical protein